MPFGMGTESSDYKLFGGGQETWTGMGGTGGAGGKGPGEWDAFGNWVSTEPGGGGGQLNQYAGQFQAYENPNSIQNRERMRMMQLADERSQFTGDYLERLRSGEDSAAQQQMQLGLGQAQRAMQQAAVSRGSNPLAQRAAVYGGGQMAQQGVTQAAMLRAQEIQGGMGLHSAAMRDRTAAEQFVQANRGQLAIQQQNVYTQQEAMKQAADEGDADVAGQVAQGVGTAALAGAAALSDERAKQDAYEMGRKDQDALARGLVGPRMSDEERIDALSKQVGSMQASGTIGGGALQGMTLGAGVPPLASGTPEQDAEANRLAQAIGAGAMRGMAMGAGSPPVESGALRGMAMGAGLPPAAPGSGALRGMAAGAGVPPLTEAGLARQMMGPMSIQVDPSQLDRTARNMDLQGFQYKPEFAGQPGAPAGQRAGVMAQDLEKDPLARQVVGNYGGGMKGIDQVQATGLSLGLHGRAAERLDALERQVGGR